MTFNWIGACQALIVFGAPATLIGALVAIGECEKEIAVIFAALFFVLVFVGGGIPWEIPCGI